MPTSGTMPEPRRFPPPSSVDDPDMKLGPATSSATLTAMRSPTSISRRNRTGYDPLGEGVRKLTEASCGFFAIVIAAAAIYFGAHDVALAQATTPNVTPPFVGLSTPITSTVTNCMMSCNSQAANCHTGCFSPAPSTSVGQPSRNIIGTTMTLNATANTVCTMGCSSSQLACQTSCSTLSSQIGR
jgi:hypothetical protein